MQNNIDSANLGAQGELIQTIDRAEVLQALLRMVEQAGDLVRISSPLLNPSVFDHENLRTVLSAMARRSRYNEVRLLVSQPQAIIERGHRLLELSRRLSSSAPMRKLDLPEHQPHAEFVLVDDCGVVEIAAGEHEPASIHFNNRARNKLLAAEFDHLWHRSHTPVELKTILV